MGWSSTVCACEVRAVPLISGLQMLWFQKQFEQQKLPLLLLQMSLADVSPKVNGKGSHVLIYVYVCVCM